MISLKYVCIGIKIVGAKVIEIWKVECRVAAPYFSVAFVEYAWLSWFLLNRSFSEKPGRNDQLAIFALLR
jgi:hypothetical protein